MIEYTGQNDVHHTYSSVEVIDTRVPLSIEHVVVRANDKCYIKTDIVSTTQNPSVLSGLCLKSSEGELIHPLEKIESQVLLQDNPSSCLKIRNCLLFFQLNLQIFYLILNWTYYIIIVLKVNHNSSEARVIICFRKKRKNKLEQSESYYRLRKKKKKEKKKKEKRNK